ncbi:monoglyceride lipase-like isoform X2 [Narcine bancroftii]|uniref:monoglyceride lipase-like isoform X2 n=1 Tax=Narcine bancroftii TaxID=1343680 RepID=UPI003831A6B2
MCPERCCCCAKRPVKNRVSPQGLSYKDLPHIVNQDGNYLSCRYWEPATPSRAMMMIIHGAGEHSGCYTKLTSVLTDLSLFVFAHDHIGQGLSEGQRLKVSSFSTYVRDCLQHIDMMRERHPTLPLFLMSHSLGGSIALNILVSKPDTIAGLIFLAPLVQINPESATPCKMCLARVMYLLLPNLSIGSLDPQWLSSSQEEVKKIKEDPLNCRGPYRMRFIVQVLRAVNKLQKLLPKISTPMLIIHGEMDKVCDINGSLLLYKTVASQDKTFKIIKGAFHHLHQEAPHINAELQNLIQDWLKDRLPPKVA